jgi:transposase
LLTGGEAHDFPLAKRLIRRVNPPEHLLGDMAYDGDELREELERHRTKSVIPNRPNRRHPFSFSKRLYKLRWRIESAFNRLKDFRRIATRYDADSDEVARAFRDDVARYSDMMSPGVRCLAGG